MVLLNLKFIKTILLKLHLTSELTYFRSIICNCLSKNQPSLLLVVFQEIPFQSIQL